jgi:LPS export ABC transporter permease LptG
MRGGGGEIGEFEFRAEAGVEQTARPSIPQPAIVRLLDRYILRNFLEPFLLCFFGFISIWLIIDLSDNGPDFIEARVSFKHVALFYLSQLPQTMLLSVPIGLLLALLFSLSRMSRTNEIISMLTAGRSVARVLGPLWVVGSLASLGCLVLNYELAPRAEATKKAALDGLTRSKKAGDRGVVEGYLFRDRMNVRTWYVRKFRPNSPEFTGVHITQQEPDGRIVKKWYARRAFYDESDRSWTLYQGLIVDFSSEDGLPRFDSFEEGERVVRGWSETPWRISSGQLDAQSLTIPDLLDYLKFNADFSADQLAPFRTYLHHRWALPWSCLVVVFIAAPLGIVYSRRGVLAGVASAIMIFFGMILFTNLCLALGKGGRLPGWVSGWLPNLVFGGVGLLLLYLRSTNRDLPRLSFRRK